MDDYYDSLELPISVEQFRALPLNPAFKYEYFGGRAYLSPRPKNYHAVLELTAAPGEVPAEVEGPGGGPLRIRPLRDDDWVGLPEVFSAAFWRVQPFSALDDARRLEAARTCLDKTRGGGDGPMVPVACRVAADPADDRPLGATLVTIQVGGIEDAESAGPPSSTREVPHLTWIFVAPGLARHGVGSALLAATVAALVEAGHTRLESTFLLGNESSTLWHWRNGFRLVGYLLSPRQLLRRRGRPGGGPAAPA